MSSSKKSVTNDHYYFNCTFVSFTNINIQIYRFQNFQQNKTKQNIDIQSMTQANQHQKP